MFRIVRICFPCCVSPALLADDERADVPLKESYGRQQPLSDFFTVAELSVLDPNLVLRLKVVIDNTLPSTLHGTSAVEKGIPLAIVNSRFHLFYISAAPRFCSAD